VEAVIQIENRSKLDEMQVSAIEKRQRLCAKSHADNTRKLIGCWIDERPMLGDKITVYQQSSVYYLETWYEDGCHSLDEMVAQKTENGIKLEDKGGNIFGEYFLLTPNHDLLFCHSQGCDYTAVKHHVDIKKGA